MIPSPCCIHRQNTDKLIMRNFSKLTGAFVWLSTQIDIAIGEGMTRLRQQDWPIEQSYRQIANAFIIKRNSFARNSGRPCKIACFIENIQLLACIDLARLPKNRE